MHEEKGAQKKNQAIFNWHFNFFDCFGISRPLLELYAAPVKEETYQAFLTVRRQILITASISPQRIVDEPRSVPAGHTFIH